MKVMTSLAEKSLPNCINALIRVLFTTIIIILVLAPSSQFTISSSFATSPPNMVTMMEREAEALLEWKASLDNQSQFRLSSWVGNTTCHWVGIACNNFSSISHINLPDSFLKGTLHTLRFSSLHSLISLNLSDNLLYGTIPSHLGNLSKLIYLDLSGNHLSGRISSELFQLTNLHILNLHENNITGSIPYQLGKLHLLNELNLSSNGLSGSIPVSIGNLTNLIFLIIYDNKLSGSIPHQLGNLTPLRILSLHHNILSGSTPASIGNLGNLTHLELSVNKLSGSICHEIGMLGSLVWLNLGKNNLSSLIPTSIGNLGNLSVFYLDNNKLSGPIPQEIGKLGSLRVLGLYRNNLSGPIPTSIGNLTNLSMLSLSDNNLWGSITSSIGNMKDLTILELFMNQLSGNIPLEIGKLKLLTSLRLFKNDLNGSIPIEFNNLTYLKHLALEQNMFSGYLPQNVCNGGSLQNFTAYNNYFIGSIPISLRNCTSLVRVRLEGNQLTGNLSEDLGIYPNLIYIDLSYNNFYGELSQKWGQCQSLQSLKIFNNRISGVIPPELGRSPKLQVLNLSFNHLVGQIPKELGKLKSLYILDLGDNQLSGGILLEIGMLSNLQILVLSANNLTGSIPKQIQGCRKLLNLNLSKNKIRGGVPTEIGNMQSIQMLDLSENLLIGKIPPQLGELRSLEILNLSHNELSGSIPTTFGEMSSLTNVDISYNCLEGPLPNNKAFSEASFGALRNNKGLCGNASSLKACPSYITWSKNVGEKRRNKVVIFFVVPILGTMVLSLIVVGILYAFLKRLRLRNKLSNPREEKNGNMFAIWSYDGKMVYERILEATEEFDSKHCVGVGGCGSVYKAYLQPGQVVAVKKLHSIQDNEITNAKAFESEIHALLEIKHRNVVKLYGFCSHPRHSFLVYKFLEGGSLKELLSNKEEAINFTWIKRANVVKGVADALSYMHHDCSLPIVHRDISSKNILLDSECVAHISDFGTARLLKPDSSNRTSFAGTFGYTAPGVHILLFVFDNREEVEKILALQPWSFDKHLVVLCRYENAILISELCFNKVSLWVQIHDIPIRILNRGMDEEICDIVGEVCKDTDISEMEGGNFFRVRVTVDVTFSLCRGRRISLENGEAGWVSLKYKRLPIICYWCGCLDHVDRDCDKWIESEGSLSQEDQEYGPWICASPYVMPRKSVIKVLGYYEFRKKLNDKRATTVSRMMTTKTPMDSAPANHKKETESVEVVGRINAGRNGKNLEQMGVMDSELFGKEFNDKIRDIDRELQNIDSEAAKNHGEGILNARVTCVDINLEKG
ncbi:hypothetical protein SO802_004168 [Lithocarpus litseifolius]|uniref:non-specific serine/threonine protein kinase n=1 Tax=Lithocarpus litseifolius TaxID=425828 RepID=A0AAW2E431_9ROSI